MKVNVKVCEPVRRRICVIIMNESANGSKKLRSKDYYPWTQSINPPVHQTYILLCTFSIFLLSNNNSVCGNQCEFSLITINKQTNKQKHMLKDERPVYLSKSTKFDAIKMPPKLFIAKKWNELKTFWTFPGIFDGLIIWACPVCIFVYIYALWSKGNIFKPENKHIRTIHLVDLRVIEEHTHTHTHTYIEEYTVWMIENSNIQTNKHTNKKNMIQNKLEWLGVG